MMRLILCITLLLCAYSKATDEIQHAPIEENNITVYDVSDKLVHLLGVDHEKERIKDLKAKLDTIGVYVVNHKLVADVLTNVTNETKLNETNFYQALNENDHFTFLFANDTKNLYLKLKEKMNRDDIMKIIAEKGQRKKLVKSARRMMQQEIPQHEHEEQINDVVDKMLGEIPYDDHKVKKNDSHLWDPQEELHEMKNYHENKLSGRRIFRGERTNIRIYPFMASVHLMGRFWCGAVLYTKDLMITSASCLQLMHNNRFFRENPRVLQVRIGSNHSRIGGEMIDVLMVYFHPGYNPRTLKCNLAVIRLRRQILFTHHVLTKCLPISPEPHTPAPTSQVLLLGWGVTKISQKMAYEPIFLQRKVLPVYPNSFCKEVYGDKFITETMFCAGTLTTGEGACDHDAGGPAILAGRLVGIISFGPAVCGFADAPTVFTLVGAYNDWIESVSESMAGYYTGHVRTTTTTKSPLGEFLATYRVGKAGHPKTTFLGPLTEPTEAGEDANLTTTTVVTTTTAVTTPVTAATGLRGGYESDGGWSIDVNN
uniref:Peptidase S1 domain-containing protein n=1 Tax=Heliothis virescens TaxID=7102 RepID=A0A2A4J7T9_HELVI